jgi:hypothetical protein
MIPAYFSHQADSPDSNHFSRASYHRANPYPSTGYRGGPRKPTYRNKTLVLNGQSQPSPSADSQATPDAASTSWVTKTDRHLQLINSAVYEKEAKARSTAIDQTQRQKQLDKDKREQAKLVSHIRQVGSVATNVATPVSKFEVEVDGLLFRVVKGGNKLVKVSGTLPRDTSLPFGRSHGTGDVNPPTATPKTTFVGGVKFHRTRNGNLIRHGIVKAQQYVSPASKTFLLTTS